jgi:hypothetical protein
MPERVGGRAARGEVLEKAAMHQSHSRSGQNLLPVSSPPAAAFD